MARVTVELPSLLGPIVGGERSVAVEAACLSGALEDLVMRRPALRVHLFDESGNLRQHVLCFHNGTNTRWLRSGEAPLSEGDTITIIQAVSGG